MPLFGQNTVGSLSGALSGAGFANTSGAANTSLAGLSSQLSGAANAAGQGGLGSALSSVGSAAAFGATVGSIIPGVGTAIGGAAGALIGGIGALFSGGGGAPDHERGDLNKIAAAYDITADQASWICGHQANNSDDNYDDVCARAANDAGYFQQILNRYNAAKPNEQIKTRTQVATEQAAPQYLQLQTQLANQFAGTGKASPLANLSFPAAQAAAKQQNMSLQDYLTAIVNGALAGLAQGAAGAAADTPAGQAATNDTLAYLAKKYQLAIAAFALLLAWLGVQAYQNNSRK